MYVDRNYRTSFNDNDLRSFRVSVKETDLHISVDAQSYSPDMEKRAEKAVLTLRYDLESYIEADSEFRVTLRPHILLPGAPEIAKIMAQAANMAGVGPMAAVAGAFAEYVGRELLKECNDVLVENGGDVFMASRESRRVMVFAGESVFSNRLVAEVLPEQMPTGICTSSGTVGPSLSLGRADAAVIIAKSTALADAAASAVGNVVIRKKDVKKGIAIARKIPGVLGALIIKDDQMAAWGDITIFPI